MAVARQRRRDGLRCINFEVRDEEVEALVKHGLLDPAQRDDPREISRALGLLLDRVPFSWWDEALRLKSPS